MILHSVIDFLIKAYGFELIPCTIPRDEFQSIKRDFYFFVYSKMNRRLFYFLNKLSPIKYLDVRPNGEIFMVKKENGIVKYEIEITEDKRYYWSNESYKVFIISKDRYTTFYIDSYTKIKNVDYYLESGIFKNRLKKLEI